MSEGYSFAGYRLLPAQRLLLDQEQPVRLGSRALDLLVALVERAGEVIPSATLIERVWPKTVVAEDNLRVHIASLRKRLAEGRGDVRFIGNVPLRGYCFVAPVQSLGAEEPVRPVVSAAASVPAQSMGGRIIGRDGVVSSLEARLHEKGFVTLVGPGGMGKTTVALAVAEASSEQYTEPPCFVDLAPLSDGRLVPAALAAALGLTLPSEQPLPALYAAMRDRRLLVVLDNCEHVIGEAAALAMGLHRHVPSVRILATSREPLRVPGEWVQRLLPLELPPLAMPPTAAEALRYTAVQLLVERATASLDSFSLSDGDAQTAAEVCRRLDGIPLAIELAAARIPMFGIQGVATRLNDRFALLTRGPRTALPRHQTLRATLDWSHDCLEVDEQRLLRQLSVFKGAFTLEGAEAVAEADVVEVMSHLVDKSLVVAVDGHCYRLLDSTRAYAAEKLALSGDREATRWRHARYCLEQLRLDIAEDVEARLRRLEEVRAALDWAIGTDDDVELGITLTAAAAPLAIGLSQMTDFKGRVQLALSRVVSSGLEYSVEEALLQRALGDLLLHTEGAGEAMQEAFRRCHEVAGRLDDPELYVMAVGGLWVAAMARGDYEAAAAHCGQLAAMVSSDDARQRLARMQAQTACFAGDFEAAVPLAQQVLRDTVGCPDEPGVVFVDARVSMRIVLARVAMARGQTAEAASWAEEAVQVANELDHAMAVCYALAFAACPAAYRRGDLSSAEVYRQQLAAMSSRHGLGYYSRWAEGYGRLSCADLVVHDIADPRLRVELTTLRADALA
ncbi:ATP-binding protein [Roseateles sp.]|uniref:ATP-binding protein n=1 Tax=Roseateles sp. TaxID=1971397 RepID=UPI0039EB742E